MEILVEFSRYKTFRGWYINNLKQKNNIKSKPISSPPKKRKQTKKNVPSIEENILKFLSVCNSFLLRVIVCYSVLIHILG